MTANIALIASVLIAPAQHPESNDSTSIADEYRKAPIEVLFYNPLESAQSFDHGAFTFLLQKHVKPIAGSSALDYAAFKRDRVLLRNYLQSLALVSQEVFDSWPNEYQLAFLINAYNAATIELILAHYPKIESIRQIRSPWSKKFISLFGKKFSLDNIEHDMIRGSGRYNEPRIHFAVNCASIGCPPLLNTAYEGEKLDAQLEASTKLFLSDKSRNFYDGQRLNISKIFSWYRKDFEQGWGGANSLAEFLSLYQESLSLNDTQISALIEGDIKIKSTSYDWDLNIIMGS